MEKIKQKIIEIREQKIVQLKQMGEQITSAKACQYVACLPAQALYKEIAEREGLDGVGLEIIRKIERGLFETGQYARTSLIAEIAAFICNPSISLRQCIRLFGLKNTPTYFFKRARLILNLLEDKDLMHKLEIKRQAFEDKKIEEIEAREKLRVEKEIRKQNKEMKSKECREAKEAKKLLMLMRRRQIEIKRQIEEEKLQQILPIQGDLQGDLVVIDKHGKDAPTGFFLENFKIIDQIGKEYLKGKQIYARTNAGREFLKKRSRTR